MAADAALSGAIKALEDRIVDLTTELKDATDDINQNEADIAAIYAELYSLKSTVQTIQQNFASDNELREVYYTLDAADDALSNAIKALEDRIVDLTAALEDATQKIEKALETKASANEVGALADRVQQSATADELNTAKQDMSNTAKKAQTIPLIIGLVAVVGNIALSIFFIITKKKAVKR